MPCDLRRRFTCTLDEPLFMLCAVHSGGGVEGSVPRFCFCPALLDCYGSNPRCWEPSSQQSNAPNLGVMHAACPNSSVSNLHSPVDTSSGYISQFQSPFGPKTHFTQPTKFLKGSFVKSMHISKQNLVPNGGRNMRRCVILTRWCVCVYSM